MTKKYAEDLAKAMRAAEKGEAYHWPTIADILATEVKRLQGPVLPKECTKCFEAEVVEVPIELDFLPVKVLGMKCPKCEDVTFTHAQSLVIDNIRRANEHPVNSSGA